MGLRSYRGRAGHPLSPKPRQTDEEEDSYGAQHDFLIFAGAPTFLETAVQDQPGLNGIKIERV